MRLAHLENIQEVRGCFLCTPVRLRRRHVGLEGCWPLSLEPASATCAVCSKASTMLPAAETKTFRKVQRIFKFGFLFLCMHLESCFFLEPSPCASYHLSWTKYICYLPVLLALSGCSLMTTRGRLAHPKLLLRTKGNDLHKATYCSPDPAGPHFLHSPHLPLSCCQALS